MLFNVGNVNINYVLRQGSPIKDPIAQIFMVNLGIKYMALEDNDDVLLLGITDSISEWQENRRKGNTA